MSFNNDNKMERLPRLMSFNKLIVKRVKRISTIYLLLHNVCHLLPPEQNSLGLTVSDVVWPSYDIYDRQRQ